MNLEGLSREERIAHIQELVKTGERHIRMHHRAGAQGLDVARLRSELVDAVLTAAYHDIVRRHPEAGNFALMAVGGYGRATLNPGSDVDLLFLMPCDSTQLPRPLEEATNEVLHLLWDIGFRVGHSVRSVNECLDQVRVDHGAMTALISMRLLAGETDLYAQLHRRFAEELVAHRKLFLDNCRHSIARRHEKSSHTVFLQEPDVKESCGGLRDYHDLCWLSRIWHPPGKPEDSVFPPTLPTQPAHEIEMARDFLHRVRNELHYQADGRKTDQLSLHLQGVLATAFGYPQKSILRRIEAFMRDYYQHSRNLNGHLASLLESVQIDEESEGHPDAEAEQLASSCFDLFMARGARIFPQNRDIFAQDADSMMRLFQHCQLRHLRLSPVAREMLTSHWKDIGRKFREDPANAEVFLAILSRKGEVARTLRQMHRSGFLGRYLPEFGALDCLVQHEFFHRYTADEHTLRFLEEIDRLIDSYDPQLAIYRDLLLAIRDPAPLYLAILLHDSGRARNSPTHAEASGELARRVCQRLGIVGSHRELVLFLVDRHLDLWRCATTKNIDDPKVIAEFAHLMGDIAHLDALMLFTYGDSTATAPDAWTSWKEMLLLQLYRRTRAYFEHGGPQFVEMLQAQRERLRANTLDTMGLGWENDIREHFARMPENYFHSAANIPAHIRAVREFRELEARAGDRFECAGQTTDFPGPGYTELVLVSRNRPQFLEKACCAIAGEGLNILSGDFHTRTDGIVVDIFRLHTSDYTPLHDDQVRLHLLSTLRELCSKDTYDPSRYLQPRRNLLRPAPRSGPAFPVHAHVRNDIDPTSTVIEIQAVDRIGLLHDLFHAINSSGLDTVHARISTEKGAALNTLYVTLPGGGQAREEHHLHELQNRLNHALSPS